jgi:hypothetical protein
VAVSNLSCCNPSPPHFYNAIQRICRAAPPKPTVSLAFWEAEPATRFLVPFRRHNAGIPQPALVSGRSDG